MALLEQLLPPEEFAQIQKMVEGGKELPLPAIISVLNQIAIAAEAAGVSHSQIPQPETGNELPIQGLESLQSTETGAAEEVLLPEGATPGATAVVPALPGEFLSGTVETLEKSTRTPGQVIREMLRSLQAKNTADPGSSALPDKSAQRDLSTLQPGKIQEMIRELLPQNSSVQNSTTFGEAVATFARTLGAATEHIPHSVGLQISGPNGLAANGTSSSSTIMLPQAINTLPGERGWDQAMGERMLWMVGRDVQSASVRINPPHLGPVDIRISIQNDQATVHFSAQHGVVREALEAAIPRLREMMAENNLQLVNVDVGQREKTDQQGLADLYQQHRRLEGEEGAMDETEEEDLEQMRAQVFQSERLVDHYV
jgi:hypothetical protein